MTKYVLKKDSSPLSYNQTEEFKKAYNTSKKKIDADKIKSPLIRYNLDDINRWLQNPVQFEDKLRKLSNFLYDTHPTYRLIVRYMALLPQYSWTLTVDTSSGNKKNIKEDYIKVLTQIDKMNLRYEMIKASLIGYKNDYFYGYEIETKDDYFILPLDNTYCRPSSIEGGIYNYSFNFTYFDANKEELDNYPPEFKRKYQQYKDTKENWIEIDSDKSVCFKVNIESDYALPIFSAMFPSIYDLEEYKELKKTRAKNENYLLLHQLIPIDDHSPDLNKFLIDLDLAAYFHEAASENLPDGIEVVTSPMQLTAVKTEKSKNDNDYVLEAMREVYNDGGISQFLFNSDKNTSTGLSKSINTDEELAFSLLRQMETWVNRKLKLMFPSIKSKFSFLDVTIFNRNDVMESLLKQAQYGLPVKLEIMSVGLNMSPLDVMNKISIENDILGLQDLLIPLVSSHTQSGDGTTQNGRPTKSEDKLGESGQQTRDNDSNAKRSDYK